MAVTAAADRSQQAEFGGHDGVFDRLTVYSLKEFQDTYGFSFVQLEWEVYKSRYDPTVLYWRHPSKLATVSNSQFQQLRVLEVPVTSQQHQQVAISEQQQSVAAPPAEQQ